MKKQSFGDVLRTTAKLSFTQIARLSLRQNSKAPEREKDLLCLKQAREMGIPEEAIAQALAAYGIQKADKSVRLLDKTRQIVEATAQGETVQASTNPFQEEGLYYLPPDEVLPAQPAPNPPTEPTWLKAKEPEKVVADQEQEYVPPLDLTQFPAQEPSPVLETPAAARSTTEPQLTLDDEVQIPTKEIHQSAPLKEAPSTFAERAAPVESPATVEVSAPPAVASAPAPQLVPEPAPAPTLGKNKFARPAAVNPAPPADSSSEVDPLRVQNDPVPAAVQLSIAGQRQDSKRLSIGEAFVRLGYGDVGTAELSDPKLGMTLMKAGRVTEEQAFRALALSRNMPFVDIALAPPHPDVAHLLDEQTCKTNRVFPYRREEDGRFVVLTDTPTRETVIRTNITERSGLHPVELRIVTKSTLDTLIRNQYTAIQNLQDINKEFQLAKTTEVNLDGDTNAVQRFLKDIITNGVARRASDIHFEPSDEGLRVRYRIDKRLRPALEEKVATHGMGNVIRVLKLMADMDIGNNREPQDNRIVMNVGHQRINLRVSSLPQSEGHEKIVMRILKEASDIPELEGLQMSPHTLERFKQVIMQATGMVIVTGPTGSGKSYTLYSALKRLATEENNVQTFEDPIEYSIPHINQSQINKKAGFTFARALESALRQDPDIILVGEIRNKETADIAIAAANTGHLIFTTIHANNAPSVIQRLRNIGVQNYDVAPALLGVMAQRLVRKICPHCSTPTQLPAHVKQAIAQSGVPIQHDARLPNYAGCPKCEGGFRGMTPIHELLAVTSQVRDVISMNGTVEEITAAARVGGMTDLLLDGYLKAAAGIISYHDVEQAVNIEYVLPEFEETDHVHAHN